MLFHLLPTLLCAAHHSEAATATSPVPVCVKSQRLFQVVRQEQSEDLQFLNDQKSNEYFFMPDISSRAQRVQGIFRDFQREYAECRSVTIDLDNLSGRDRILLMYNIMAEKRSKPLPKESETSAYWQIRRQGFYSFFVDLYPTTYRFGQRMYQIESQPISNQVDNAVLFVLSSANDRACYDNLQIYLRLMEISKTVPRLTHLIKKARKSGIAMTLEQGFVKQEDTDFCNYVIVQEDFAVARHSVRQSSVEAGVRALYTELPISVGISRLQILGEKEGGPFSYGQHFGDKNPYYFYSEWKERRAAALKRISAQVVPQFFRNVDFSVPLDTTQGVIHTVEGVHQELIDTYENDGYESPTVYDEPLMAVPLIVEERDAPHTDVSYALRGQPQGVHQRSKKYAKSFGAARATDWQGAADKEPLFTPGNGHTKTE
jgi:hypothetical protein